MTSEPLDQDLLSFSDTLKHSGLTKQLLHAWERRFGLSPDKKTETGRRFYTFEKAERLRLLKACTDAGHRISRVLPLPIEELILLEDRAADHLRLAPAVELLKSRKLGELEAWLAERATQQSIPDFICSTASPFMQSVGELWAHKELSIADEHYVTVCVKRILLSLFDALPAAQPVAPWLISTTPEGEAHELGALCAALLGRSAGWNVLYLGPSLPVNEIADMAERYTARCVCLSNIALPEKRFRGLIEKLRVSISDRTDLIIGGPSNQQFQSVEQMIFVKDMRELNDYFMR